MLLALNKWGNVNSFDLNPFAKALTWDWSVISYQDIHLLLKITYCGQNEKNVACLIKSDVYVNFYTESSIYI